MTNINTSLQDFAKPLDAMQTHPTNPRRGNVDAIKESLTRFGQLRPIIVQQSSGYIVAGNHTYRAVTELGWDKIAAVNIELSDEEAEAYLVADNRIGDLGDYDNAVLAPLLERMMLAGRLEGTGYSPDDVDDMLSAMNALPDIEPGDTEAEHADSEEIQRRFANRTTTGPQRQFVLLYDQGTGQEVEQLFADLKRAWGMERTIDVAVEALRRAKLGLSEGEQVAAASAPEPEVVADEDADMQVHSPQTGEVTEVSGQEAATFNPTTQGFDASDTADAQEDQARAEAEAKPELLPDPADQQNVANAEPVTVSTEPVQRGYKAVSNADAAEAWQDDDAVDVKANDDGSVTLFNKKRWESTRDEAHASGASGLTTFGAWMSARHPA